MKSISRPLVYTLLALIFIAVLAFLVALAPHHGPDVFFLDEDLSDSAWAWLIVIPVLILVAVIVTAVIAGVAAVVVLAVMFAALMVVLGLTAAMLPFVVILGIPVLAIYGIVKLVQRDRRDAARASAPPALPAA